MSDRDRLAADLHYATCDPRLMDHCDADHEEQADRLIALGWTWYAPESLLTRQEHEQGLRDAPIDEERLARALERVRPIPGTYRDWAIAVAKAYREDEG